MPRFAKMSARPLAMLFGALAFGSPVFAQSIEIFPPFVYPPNGGSTVDTFYAMFPTRCGLPSLDPSRAPEVVRRQPTGSVDAVDEIEVTFFVLPGDAACVDNQTRPELIPIELGPMQEGLTTVFLTLKQLGASPGGTTYPIGDTFHSSIDIGDSPNLSLSGTWFSPEAAGTGVSISLSEPSIAGSEPTAVLFLATLTPEGEPVWYTGAGTFVDSVLQVPLTRSSAPGVGGAITSPVVGTATFEYAGCGAAHLSVDGIGLRFPGSEGADLQQLTGTAGVLSCHPPQSLSTTR